MRQEELDFIYGWCDLGLLWIDLPDFQAYWWVM